jgi:predicted ester cyclase
MPMNENVEALERARLRWNAGDLYGYLELYDENAVFHGIAGREPGLAGIRAFYEGFWSAFPGSQLVFEDVFSLGEKVACRFVLHARHADTFLGIDATGQRVTIPGISILRFRDGRCVERWSQADFLGVVAQLGALDVAYGEAARS